MVLSGPYLVSHNVVAKLTLKIFINHLLSATFFSIHRPLCTVVKGAGRTGITRFSINHPSSDRISGMLPPALTRHVPAWSLKEWVPSGTKGRGTHVTYAGHESGHSQRHRLTMTDNCLHEFCCMFTVVHWLAILRKIKRGVKNKERSKKLHPFYSKGYSKNLKFKMVDGWQCLVGFPILDHAICS